MHRTMSRRELLLAPSSHPLVAAKPRPVLSAEMHLLSRATFAPTPRALADLQTLGTEGWLEQQLEPGSVDDSAFEALLPTLIAPTANAAADVRLLARAVYSRRQLAWRMVHFLNNHFATYRAETQAVSETQEDEAFYKNCFSTFGTVLRESAQSPAMIDFLDSATNIAASPNENYARELMELHTLGVGGGYTEPDVAQVARVFTGWSRTNVITGTVVTHSVFRFRANVHDTGPKSVSFGWSTPGVSGAAGVNEGLQFLDFLASRPATAAYFCAKLCRYFVADQPPAGLVARVEQMFRATGGDLRETVRAIFTDPEFATTATAKAKAHDGFEFVASTLRRLRFPSVNFTQMNNRVALLRAQPHQTPTPDGYPEIGAAWQGAGHVLPRWDFADDVAHDRITGAVVPWSALFGATPPTSGAQWANTLCAMLLDGEVPPTTIVALTVFMDQRIATLPANPTWTQMRPHARALASIVMRLPEAQLH
jgi:uncharacterized protein (DUF1800 family)